MKFGILTFHEADSYGAVLQAYALQQTLCRLGCDSEFVQFETPANTASAPPAGGAASVFVRRLQIEGQKRKALFDDFRQKYMQISRPYLPTENIDEQYDCFLAGSDQIWNFRIPGADARYFLPFARPEKRYSYAASFGADALPEKAIPWVSRQLSAFHGISVREESGCGIVRQLTGREAEVCLDPTLLLERSAWEALMPQQSTEPYFLLFLLKYDEDLAAKAREAAEKEGVSLRIVAASFMPQMGISAWNTTGVTDWLCAIRDAQCVFTNTFHGMAFSLIFGKRLRVQLLGGELSSRNGRLEELLAFLDLSEATQRIVEPDYHKVWKTLEPRRSASLAYLRGIMDAAI